MQQFVRTFEKATLAALVDAIEATMVNQHAKIISTAPLASRVGYHSMMVVFEKLVP